MILLHAYKHHSIVKNVLFLSNVLSFKLYFSLIIFIRFKPLRTLFLPRKKKGKQKYCRHLRISLNSDPRCTGCSICLYLPNINFPEHLETVPFDETVFDNDMLSSKVSIMFAVHNRLYMQTYRDNRQL